MKYRKFGNMDYEVSVLGFGCMRLPVKNNRTIDEKLATNMIRFAIDNGVNYIDTAWPYHEETSEIVVGKALKNGYRERVKIATKLPSRLINKPEDMDMFLNRQLKKLQTEQIDFYLLHGLNNKYWENYKKLHVFKWIEKVLKQGKVKYIGFSFHDNYNAFRDIVDAYNWDFCQIQYNYLDVDFQAGKKGLKYATEKGMATVIMEPLRGGSLVGTIPEQIKSLFNNTIQKRSLADWALQWLWNQSEISVVLSGMSTMEQVKENIKSANQASINSLLEKDLKIIQEVRENYRKLSSILCTGCEYCSPCPNGVDIAFNFRIYNEAHLHNAYKEKVKKYFSWQKEARASNCISCGQCEKLCPQDLKISSLLNKVANYFENA